MASSKNFNGIVLGAINQSLEKTKQRASGDPAKSIYGYRSLLFNEAEFSDCFNRVRIENDPHVPYAVLRPIRFKYDLPKEIVVYIVFTNKHNQKYMLVNYQGTARTPDMFGAISGRVAEEDLVQCQRQFARVNEWNFCDTAAIRLIRNYTGLEVTFNDLHAIRPKEQKGWKLEYYIKMDETSYTKLYNGNPKPTYIGSKIDDKSINKLVSLKGAVMFSSIYHAFVPFDTLNTQSNVPLEMKRMIQILQRIWS